jgi:SIR2-like domain
LSHTFRYAVGVEGTAYPWRVDVEELIRRLRADPGRVLPFVGSGLTVGAGAPSATSLARELARRADVSVGAAASLSEVSTAAEGAVGTLAVQEHLAEVITGLRLRPTPALTALCGVSGGRVLTTNYDDAIERSAVSRGLEPVPLLPTDVRMLEVPQSGELQVVHLHGMPGVPSSLVLPGRTTNELVSNSVFERFLSATMAPSNVLYLGFSFGLAELHLRSLLAWLATEVEDPSQQYLLLPDEDVQKRRDDMALFAGLGFVDVVAYEADLRHSVVERVAITLAPRAPRSGEGTMPWRTRPTWVQPVMVRAEPGEGRERLQQQIAGFDFGWAGAEALAGAGQVLEVGRAIVIAAPGMGKSTLMQWLPAMAGEGAGERLCARGELGDFAPARAGAPVEEGIARLLLLVDDGERIAIEDLLGGGAVLLLDGLDEVDEGVRDQAAAAISAAVSRWPGHIMPTSGLCRYASPIWLWEP